MMEVGNVGVRVGDVEALPDGGGGGEGVRGVGLFGGVQVEVHVLASDARCSHEGFAAMLAIRRAGTVVLALCHAAVLTLPCWRPRG